MSGRGFRVGVRTRLLLAVVGVVSVALVIGGVAFNLLLDQRLTDSATALEGGGRRGEVVAPGCRRAARDPRGPGREARSDSPVWVFAGTRPLEIPRVSPSLTTVAASLAGGPEHSVRVGEETRLYAFPVVRGGERVGTVVAAPPRPSSRCAGSGRAATTAPASRLSMRTPSR